VTKFRRRGSKGVRWIDGREYLLCGRESNKEHAQWHATALREQWERVRIVKLNDWDYLLYVHARKG